MFSNLGLKLKVFFLMAVVIATLSAVNFGLFKSFIDKIDVQQGPQNAVLLAQESIKNTTYSLISNSFHISKQLKFLKASKNAPLRINEITSKTEYVIVDQSGSFVAGDIKLMSSYEGIPAVERALKEGFASDGTIVVADIMYLLGVAPVYADVPDEGKKLFAVISVKKLSLAFDPNIFTMPTRIFLGNKFVAETVPSKWSEVEKSCGNEKMLTAVDDLIKSQGKKILNRWTYLNSFFMPFDMLGGEKVVVVTMVSSIPGWEDYKKVVMYSILYTLAAIIITLFFTFIVTHTIDKVFRNLATDISKLKVGEKLVMKKYSHGADIAVSALNTLISKYLRHNENSESISSGVNDPMRREDNLLRNNLDIGKVADPFGVDDIEDTPKKPLKSLDPQPNLNAINKKAPPPSFFHDDEDDEKTQIVETSNKNSFVERSIAPEPLKVDPIEILWLDYCKIKEKNGEKVTENEKRSFIGKVRTNRASIMAKYKCSDVQFMIEEKDGKPVIKAKPLNG